MSCLRIVLAGFACGAVALTAILCVPRGWQAGQMLAVADEPAAIADRALDRAFDRATAIRETEAALAAGDTDLAQSFIDLARDRGLEVPSELVRRTAGAVERDGSVIGSAKRFALGLVTGEPEDAVGFAGTVAGDLFVFGDIRDAVREGGRYLRGQQADELLLGLACLGMAITAGTYATVGAGAPVRVGLSAVKAVRKSGRIGAGMAGWIGRSLHGVVDWSAFRRAGAAVTQPAVAVRAVRQAVKVEKADGLLRLAGDVGRVQARAGSKAALDGLRVAQGPAEMTRIAKLAEKKGSRTRAILKLLGRGAIMLPVAIVNLVLWLLSAAASLLGCVATLKAFVERATLAYLRRRRRQHERHAMLRMSRS